MKTKLKILTVISALCFLGSITCYSAVAAELIRQPSAEDETPAVIAEDPVPVDPVPADEPVVDPGYTEPTEPVDPGYVEPTDPEPTESVYIEPTDPPQGEDPEYPVVSEPNYSEAYESLISEGNFPQPVVSTVESTYSYVDNTQQYNQYIYNNNQAQYDDNYIYVPEYTEPTQSLISTASKVVDTDELTNDDWKSIVLDLSNGNVDGKGGAQTFSFIKDNEEEGDTNMMWLVYLGTALIIASILLIIFVIVSTTKANAKKEEYYYV